MANKGIITYLCIVINDKTKKSFLKINGQKHLVFGDYFYEEANDFNDSIRENPDGLKDKELSDKIREIFIEAKKLKYIK